MARTVYCGNLPNISLMTQNLLGTEGWGNYVCLSALVPSGNTPTLRPFQCNSPTHPRGSRGGGNKWLVHNLITSFLPSQSLEKAVGTSIRRNNQSRQLNRRETTATDDDFLSLSEKHPTYHRTSNQGFKTSKLVKYSGLKSIFYTLNLIFSSKISSNWTFGVI